MQILQWMAFDFKILIMIYGNCSFCNEKADGYNILGNFCRTHKELFVRDWTKQSLDELFKEFPNEDRNNLTKLFKRYYI